MTGRGPSRRTLLAGAALLWPAMARGQTPPQQQQRRPVVDPPGPPPVVFVHGNGDSAALWINNLWRFEANGYKRNHLFAIDFPYPNARLDDSRPQPLRSSTEDAMKALQAYVAQVRKTTRRPKVALIASSRGGNTVRNYLKNGGGAEFVSHAILCGTPNKGIVISDTILAGSEFNGAAPFLKGLNAGANDLIPGVEMMAIRSDKNDKYSQPDARFVGQPGKPTGVGFDASELRGAKNVILEGLDHREVAFHKLAFAAQFEFITHQLDAFRENTVTFGVAGTLALVWGALGFFGAISAAVNHAWGVERNRPYWSHKLFSFLMLCVAGALLVAAVLLVSAAQIVEATWFAQVLLRFPGLAVLRSFALRNATTAMFILVVGFVYYFVPNTRVRFRDVWIGACLTGALWKGALFVLAWYMRDMSRFTQVNGSIAAVVVFLVWVYVQAVILLYGVECTAAYARLRANLSSAAPSR